MPSPALHPSWPLALHVCVDCAIASCSAACLCLSLCAAQPIVGAGVTPETSVATSCAVAVACHPLLGACSRRWQSPSAAASCTSTQYIAETSEGLSRASQGLHSSLQHLE